MGRKRNDEAILKVWYALEEQPLTLAELVDETGLGESAVKTALKHINHELQRQNKQPVAIDRATWRYSLPSENDLFFAWHINRLKDAATRLATEWERSEAAFGKWHSRNQRKVSRRLELLREDIDDVIVELTERQSI